jgi:hypothetical protein
MCYIITLSIDRSFVDTINHSANGELYIESNHNMSLNKHLPKNFISFDLLLGGCSCGLYEPDYDVRTKLTAKYRKKGWTAAEIERAMAGKKILEGLCEDVKCFIKNWVIQYKYVIFFIHWYSGSADSEKIEETSKKILSLEEFYHHPKIKENVFYHIKLT